MSKSRVAKPVSLLSLVYDSKYKYEIGCDEVGRGPLFGRLYVAAVVLPIDGSFDGTNVKDSKKFSSKKKILEVSDYIKKASVAWHIHYIEADIIDDINILQAVYKGMHECVRQMILKLEKMHDNLNSASPLNPLNDIILLIDGDRFKPYCIFNEETQSIQEMNYVTIEQGDAKMMSIAAASIIAKVEHDKYIEDLCKEYPDLITRYNINKNVGYGTKAHLDGIREHGISQWHRKTYGICKTVSLNHIEPGITTIPTSESL